MIYCWGTGSGFVPGHRASLPAGNERGQLIIPAALDHRQGGLTVGWGANFFGQLGDGTLTSRSVPTPVLGWPQMESGARRRSPHLRGDHGNNRAFCWGRDSEGQVGDGTPDNSCGAASGTGRRRA